MSSRARCFSGAAFAALITISAAPAPPLAKRPPAQRNPILAEKAEVEGDDRPGAPRLAGEQKASAAHPVKTDVAFEPSPGRMSAAFPFKATSGNATVLFSTAHPGLTFVPRIRPRSGSNLKAALSARPWKVTFVGAEASPRLEAGPPARGKVNYLIGNDPAGWLANVSTYRSIVYRRLYPGIDLEYKGTGGRLKGTYSVAPNADPLSIRWRYGASGRPAVDRAGNLHVSQVGSGPQAARTKGAGTMTEKAPRAWQAGTRGKREVKVGFRVHRDNTVGFRLGSYDRRMPLTIDPVLIYSTFLGGTSADAGLGIAADANGNAYVAGTTSSNDFPVSAPDGSAPYRQASPGGAINAFVTKFDPQGNLVYSTYLGGSDSDSGAAIAVDAQGQAYVAGTSSSNDFPTTPGAYRSTGPGFVSKLNPQGSGLVFSTRHEEEIWNVALDGNGNSVFSGQSAGGLQTTPNAFQPQISGPRDAFISKLNEQGTAITFSSYLGGNGEDYSSATAAGPDGLAYLTGYTGSESGFATPNAFDRNRGGSWDSFAAKVDTVGGRLIYATYLGGTQGEDASLASIAADVDGNAYATGRTCSRRDFPISKRELPQAENRPFQTDEDTWEECPSYITKFDRTGAPQYSTFLGGTSDPGLKNPLNLNSGSGGTRITDIDVDPQGAAQVVGLTDVETYPVKDPLQRDHAGVQHPNEDQNDAFIAKLDRTGSSLLFSTFLGGVLDDYAFGVAATGGGNVYIGGQTQSVDFPTKNPSQGQNRGGTGTVAGGDPRLHSLGIAGDGFVARICEVCPPTLSVGPVSVAEGDLARFMVSHNSESGDLLTARYETRDGSARSGADFQAAEGELQFGRGRNSQVIEVPTINDPQIEPDENFLIELIDPERKIVLATAEATVLSDDRAAPPQKPDEVDPAFDPRGSPVSAVNPPLGTAAPPISTPGGPPAAAAPPVSAPPAPPAGSSAPTLVPGSQSAQAPSPGGLVAPVSQPVPAAHPLPGVEPIPVAHPLAGTEQNHEDPEAAPEHGRLNMVGRGAGSAPGASVAGAGVVLMCAWTAAVCLNRRRRPAWAPAYNSFRCSI